MLTKISLQRVIKLSSASNRKVSNYNGEPDVDAYLEQFDLVATYNGWLESGKVIVSLQFKRCCSISHAYGPCQRVPNL